MSEAVAMDGAAPGPTQEDAAVEAEALDGGVLGPRDWCLVGADGSALEVGQTFLVAELPGAAGEASKLASVIPIVVVGDRLLGALPASVWHRSPARRVLRQALVTCFGPEPGPASGSGAVASSSGAGPNKRWCAAQGQKKAAKHGN